jgi:LexA DNA binding domain
MFIVDPPLLRTTMNRTADSRPDFTPKQGQYLAFIHAYTLVNGRPPAAADMMRFFRVAPPSVHQMVLGLEKAGLISRQPAVPRSIALLLDRSDLPELNPGTLNQSKSL